MKIIPPKYDKYMKGIFRNTEVLKHFISDILTIPIEHIQSSKLKRCVAISILDFNLTPGKEYHNIYCLRNRHGDEFSDVFGIHTLELGYPAFASEFPFRGNRKSCKR